MLMGYFLFHLRAHRVANFENVCPPTSENRPIEKNKEMQLRAGALDNNFEGKVIRPTELRPRWTPVAALLIKQQN